MESVAQYDVEYIVAKRKTIGIRIRPDGTIVVRYPSWTNRRAAERFVADKHEWIVVKLNKMESRTPFVGMSGETLYLGGEPLVLKVEQSRKNHVYVEQGILHVSVKSTDPGKVKKVVIDWYTKQAKMLFTDRLHDIAHKCGIDVVPDLVVKNLKSRWGSMSSDGAMTLSLALVCVPVRALDQVIAHELVHLTVRNHGPNFYALLEQHYPEWREHKKLLSGKYMLK